ncbi:MAG: DUF493 domain-containing protein [Gammaproteobacteria bacterium]|nr:DUF493 domain-containing protein [Gammaproteobacteria bacterium]
MDKDEASPLDFPCRYPVKAMGRADADIEQTVWRIVSQHAPNTASDDIQVKPSRNGRFLSVTVTIIAESRTQLDAMYAELQAHQAILAAL